MVTPTTIDNSSSSSASDRFIRYSWLISTICYIAGIGGFIFLIDNCDKTYISDNALTPGLVNREFAAKPDSFIKPLREASEAQNHSIPHSWLVNSFTRFGLEVYTQHFSARTLLGDKEESGTNVYAIFRAPRAQPLESLILAAPFRSDISTQGSNHCGIALMLSLAKYFASKNYWAKDIIFLVTDSEWIGVQAWLNAFHGIPDEVIRADSLSGISGSIQAALVLDINATRMSRMNLKIEGLNGQLPNLDLFNTVVELATHESITPTFHGRSHTYAEDAWPEFIETTGKMMMHQASSFPTGAHGLFLKFAIQSLTISIDSTGDIYEHFNLLHIGRVVEGVFRSLNNLLEKFNRSFWFYLLPSTQKYISIAFYMSTFALIAVPLLIVSLKNYIILHSGEKYFMNSKESLESGFIGCFVCHILGSIALTIPYLIEPHVSTLYSFLPSNFLINDASQSNQIVLYTSLMTYSFVSCVLPFINRCFISAPAAMIIALLNMALLLVSIALINISLGKFLAIIYVPICCFLQISSNSKALKLLKKLTLLIVHPLTLNFLCSLAISYFEMPMSHFSSHASKAFEKQQQVLLKYVQHWYLYGNWTYFMATGLLLPVWLQFWHLSS